MKRPFIVAGNWKMNLSLDDVAPLIDGMRNFIVPENTQVILLPQIGLLSDTAKMTKDTKLKLGAQNTSEHVDGAFTGETSPKLLKELGAQYCLVGHSERRTLYGENNPLCALKTKRLLEQGIIPILCVGETETEREENRFHEVIKTQIETVYEALTVEERTKVITAYEPVWAIGSGKAATPQQASEIHQFMRKILSRFTPNGLNNSTVIIYGGSVKEENSRDFLDFSDIDGFLVGRASLNASDFLGIVRSNS